MYSEDMLRRKPNNLSCPNCKRTGRFPIGPAKEQAQCDHCGTLFQVPHLNIRRRRWLEAIGIGVIVNLLTPNWWVWDLFRPRVRPLHVVVNDKINLGDEIHLSGESHGHATVSAQLIVGNRGISSAEAFGAGGAVTHVS